MKSLIFLLFALLLIYSANITAQDYKNINPKIDQILVDTTLVRAALITLEPGQKTNIHSHPAYFAYALTDGKLLVNYIDKTTETIELKAGESMFSLPERPHETKNIGTKTIKFLIVELKEHPYKD
jgi:quercetin dioxygenase-like cupin family protein